MVPIGAGGVSKIAAGGAAAVAGGVAGGAVTGASGCGTVSAGGAVVSAGAVSCAKAGAAKPPRAVPSRSAEQSRRLLEIALIAVTRPRPLRLSPVIRPARLRIFERSAEHTSELQSLMRISYAVLCLKNKTTQQKQTKYEYK